MILSLKTYQKLFLCYHLPCSLKIFINVSSFLLVKANSRKICGEISFPFFSEKNANVSSFRDSRLIIAVFFVDSNNPN